MLSIAALRTWSHRPGVRTRTSDAAYALVAGTDAVSTAAQTYVLNGPVRALSVAVLGCAAAAALVLVRRTAPMTALLVAVPATVVGGIDVVLPMAVFAYAIRRRDRGLGLAAALAWATFVAAGSAGVGSGGSGGWADGALTGAVVVALAASGGAYVGARRDLVVSLRERAEQAEATARLVREQARLAERTRIAREMHDVVAHRISLVALHAGALEVNPGSGPEHVERAAALIGTTARQALEDLRGVLGVLRSDSDRAEPGSVPDLSPQPRLDDLPRLVAASVAAGVPVTFEDRRPEGSRDVDEIVARTVYRVVQEALTNVHKHARDAATCVVLDGGGDRPLGVEVANVRPVARSALVPGAGAGLVGLRERVALAGGTFDVSAAPGGGWRVRAEFGRGTS